MPGGAAGLATRRQQRPTANYEANSVPDMVFLLKNNLLHVQEVLHPERRQRKM